MYLWSSCCGPGAVLGLGHSGDETDSMWLMIPAAQGVPDIKQIITAHYSPATVLGAPGRPQAGFHVPQAQLLSWVGALDSHAAVVTLSSWGRTRAQEQGRDSWESSLGFSGPLLWPGCRGPSYHASLCHLHKSLAFSRSGARELFASDSEPKGSLGSGLAGATVTAH